MTDPHKAPIDKLVLPVQRFIQQEKSGGLVLGISVILALILANSPWHSWYFAFFEQTLGIVFNGETYFNMSLLHWINDGLMAIFFFVVGLELKREFVGGELSNPRQAMLPIIAALGGMLVPALIYLSFNPAGEVHQGWGIPMATDIAFALGVLYLLGDRIPLGLKVFLAALAIVDDLGAVVVIALFYTSDISLVSLVVGFLFLLVMWVGNRIGIRSVLFYAIFGIGGVWVAFLMSGVHATIAAVLAAFMIPAKVRIDERVFVARLKKHLNRFLRIDPDNKTPFLTDRQYHILERIELDNKRAIPPVQLLEHSMHPLVTFIILPIFALANAGVTFLDINSEVLFSSNVAIGVALGLFVGKVVGVMGFTWLSIKLGIAPFPNGMNPKNLFGLSLLAAIGFTMSLFITQLAFVHEEYQMQAKIGIFAASIVGGMLGYTVLKRTTAKAGTE